MPAPIPPAFPRKPCDKPFVLTATGGQAPEWIEVVCWRYEELRRAGYPADEAMELSTARDIDLHEACDLLQAGASPELAAKILL